MTDECCTTVIMPLQINVSCLNVDQIAGNKNKLDIYQNPAKNYLSIKFFSNKNWNIWGLKVTNMSGNKS